MAELWYAAALSAGHVLALGIGLPGVFLRARALSRGDVPAALAADNAWGVAALLWLGTGLLRAFGGVEKGAAFYLASTTFHLKLGLFGLVFLLELWPMVTLIRWRLARGRGDVPDTAAMPWLARISAAETAVVLAIPFVAAAMARGL